MSRFRKAFVLLFAVGLGLMTGYASAASEDIQAEIARIERQEQSPEKRADALLQLGHQYAKQSRLGDAEILYRRALAIGEQFLGSGHPSLGPSLLFLASIYDRQSRSADAEVLYRRALVIVEKSLGSDHLVVAQILHNLGGLLDKRGEFSRAEPLYKRSLTIREKALGADHPQVAAGLNNLAMTYQTQGKYALAEPLLKRSLAIRERVLGADHPDVAQSLNSLAELFRAQGEYTQAEPLYKRSLVIWEKALGPDHPEVATGLNNLANLYYTQGQYTHSESLRKRSLAIYEKVYGPDHPYVATSLHNLAILHGAQGEFAQAESLYKRSLAIIEKALGPNHTDVAEVLNTLANLYVTQGQYTQAEPLYKRSLAIRETALGADHPSVATSLNNLGMFYRVQGQYAQAEPLYMRALSIMEKSLGAGHSSVAMSLNNVAEFRIAQGKYAEAESLLKRSLAINEKALGANHPDVAWSLSNLATIYHTHGQYALAEPLFMRSLAIREKILGPDHPAVATSLNNVAELHRVQGQYAQAEPLYKRSLAISEKALGKNHPSVATSLNNLALLFDAQGRYAQAEPLFKRSREISEKNLGGDHPDVASSLNNLAGLYVAQNQYAQAEPLYKRSLAIFEKSLGADHPNVALSLNNLAKLSTNQRLYAQALSYSRQATVIYRKRVRENAERQAGKERLENRSGFLQHLSMLDKAAGQVSRLEITGEGFALVQMIQGSDTANALAKSVARFSAPSDELAEVVRREQDARARYQRLDEELVKALSAPTKARNPEKENRIRAEISQLDEEIQRLGNILAERFPDYAALVSREPISLEDTQKMLRSYEALLVYALDGDRAYLWVVRPDRAQFLPLAAKPSQIITLTNRVRASLVADNPLITPFDATAAYELYREIFAPALPLLDGVTDILVVPSGPLSGLPLGVLLGSPPKEGKLKLEDHRELDWLIKRYRFATLPAVISLKALRKHGKARLADQLPFFGIGDPVLEGDAGETRAGKSAPRTGLFPRRGSVANVDALRKLPSLPDTTDELKAIASALGADPSALYLRQRATESNAKAQALDRYRVLAFATHGLLGGEATDVAEPGLVLTPPQQGTIDDDGYLGASEVAQLKLNADWVVLSACNTAAADGTPGAEGLTGLAKSFFYAGARALLVSHWPVISSATTKLITDTFQHHAKKPEQGKSGALQKAMLDMMNDANRPEQAHPAFWAPFVVVGDGR